MNSLSKYHIGAQRGKGEKMNDLISRQAALDIIDSELNGWLTDDERLHLEGVAIGIECLPRIDQVKHGKWMDGKYMGFDGCFIWHRECSICGYERSDDNPDKDTPYCPNCGAKMEIE